MSDTPNSAERIATVGLDPVGRSLLGPLAATLLMATSLWGCGASKAEGVDAAAAKEKAPPDVVWRGVPLGEFRIQHTRPLENLKVSLSFELTASIGEPREERLQRLVDARKHRLRDQVIVAVRAAPTHVFDEPELTDLRHRIHLRVEDVLDGVKIADIYLTDFDCQID